MQLQPEQLNEYFKPVFIFASKTQSETVFFLQIVDSEKRANRLKSFFLGKGDEITWYMYKTTLPLYCPPEIDKVDFFDINLPVTDQTINPVNETGYKPISNAELF